MHLTNADFTKIAQLVEISLEKTFDRKFAENNKVLEDRLEIKFDEKLEKRLLENNLILEARFDEKLEKRLAENNLVIEASFDKKLSTLETRLDNKLISLETKLTERFELILDDKLAKQNTNFDKIIVEMRAMSARIDNLLFHMVDVKDRLTNLENAVFPQIAV